jgi:UDP-glucose 4-epimerase
MRVLVAGGAGYIGSVTAKLLIEHGHQVVVFDNLSRGHRSAVDPNAVFVHGELGDSKLLRSTLKENKIKAVMHFAAHSLVGESMEKPEIYFENNVTVGHSILESMRFEGVDNMIFSSTCAVFGEPDELPMHELLPKCPTSVYGETKEMFERMLTWYHAIHGLNFTSLRYFNACGAHGNLGEDHKPESHLIPLVLQVALGKRDKIAIFGDDYPTADGTCIRDYIHIYDLAMAHLLALEKSLEGASFFNLGNGDGYSVSEVIQTSREVTGHPIPTEITQRRPGDPAELVSSSDRIRQDLGWRPEFPDLESIVRSAWRWHKDHPNGYLD